MVTLEKICSALEREAPEVVIDEVRRRAEGSIRRMLQITEANNSNNEKRTRRRYETVYRAVPGFVGGRVGVRADEGMAASHLPTEVEYKRYEGPRVPIVRGGYLRCQPVCDQGCRRDFSAAGVPERWFPTGDWC